MAHFDLRVLTRLGPWGALKTLYKMRTMKVGALIGTDFRGNQYFENREEYAHGQHRWVVYAGDKTFYEVDSSTVPPEWHAWLHHVTEAPPTAATLGSTAATPPQAIASGSSNPYARSLGGVVTEHPPPNTSSVRPRGWGVGNGLGSAGSAPFEPLGAYTQPGLPTDPRNATFYGPRGGRAVGSAQRATRLGFTLADTPLTLAARESARAGLPLPEFARYVDEDSPTNILLRLSGGSITAGEAAALARDPSLPPEEVAFLEEAAAGLPTDPRAHALAARLATQDDQPSDAYDAALARALTPAELEVHDLEAEDAVGEAARYQKFVDDYKDIRSRDAAAGVEAAIVKRDALLAQVRVCVCVCVCVCDCSSA
jgi:NADH:ubiquinone oxidoreductase subunit